MNARFETPSRYSAAGLTTAAVLIVMVAMALSTLFPEASSAGPSAAASHSQVAQSHGSRSVKKS